jgi:hypothetical protein
VEAHGEKPLVGDCSGAREEPGCLGLDGVTVRFADARGLADIAALLGMPGRPVPAADLVAAGAVAAGAQLRMGADGVLDERARREYRARLAEVDEEIEEAERWADPERAARAREEREALLAELSAAAGLGGRPQRLGDQSERARKAVTAGIRDVIGRLEAEHPALRALQGRPRDVDRFLAVIAGAVPGRFFNPATLIRLLGLRGLASIALSGRRAA